MRWIRATQAVVAVLVVATACEDLPIVQPDPEEDSVRRIWSFSSMSLLSQQTLGWMDAGDVRRQLGGSVDDGHTFGPAALDLADNLATGRVVSADGGFDHFTSAEAPYTPQLDSTEAIGGRSTLVQYQRFRKTEADARLQYVVQDVYLEALDENSTGIIGSNECPWQDDGEPRLLCNRLLWAWVTLDVNVVRVPARGWCAELDDECLYRAAGRVDLFGWYDNWTLEAMSTGVLPGGLWADTDFRLEDASTDEISHARGLLNAPVTVDIPLDHLPLGDTIEVRIHVESAAMNHRQNELQAFVFAHLNDSGGAAGLEFVRQGLEPVETPDQEADELESEARAVAACGPAGGSVEFVTDAFHAPEWPAGRAPIVLRRTGGSGPMSVLLSTSGGSATAGADYEELSTQVLFDGAADEVRGVDLRLLGDDAVEGAETVTLTLSDPACGTLGGVTNATFTIHDDDRDDAPSYSVGGSISGLEGSGLVLSNLGRRLDVTQNGPFVFAGGWAPGTPYDVTVVEQPANPAQACTVANGSGTIGDAPVEDVLVTCITVESGTGIDESFGTDGRVWADITPYFEANFAAEVELHGDGILIAGDDAIARYHADGVLDTAFGSGGTAAVRPGSSAHILALSVLDDGRILVAGGVLDGANSPTRDDFVLMRYLADGTLDTAFGNAGVVMTDFEGWPDGAYDILVQPDGSIILAGIAHSVDSFGATNADFALARFTSAGAPDATFGPDGTGRVVVDVSGDADVAHAAALLPDGRILLVGRAQPRSVSDPDIGIAVFDADGNLDTSFGNGGLIHVGTSESDRYNDVAIDAAGRILVSGWRVLSGAYHYLVAAYDANGNPDPSFGSAGEVTGPEIGQGNGIAIDVSGRLLLAGRVGSDFGVIRLHADGSLDSSFGGAGVVSADFFGGSDEASDVLVQPDGRIIVAGQASNGIDRGVGVIRVIP